MFAHAEGECITWAEAAAAVGGADPAALGERVRRNVKRLAAEQKIARSSSAPVTY
ncbi:hypothetical protein ABT040_44675 [Streptomyces sp. NPDC002688]|uniref:hypothetical protein n=1 Tax=Streptomyces sp. NPDC002688 TaxID=3154423 RepID=UPI003320E8F5